MKAYSLSKPMNTHFTQALAKLLEDTNIKTNVLYLGVVRANFGNNLLGFMKLIFALVKPLMISSGKGASTSVYLANPPEVANIPGKCLAKKKTQSV